MTLEESKVESDIVEEVEGLSFLINEQDQIYFKDGVGIRFVSSPWFGTGLKVEPLNQTNSYC